MNKLTFFKKLNFVITWKLIYIGLVGCDEIPALLTHQELKEHLYDELKNSNDDNYIIQLICEDNSENVVSLIKRRSEAENSKLFLQKQKWLVYMACDLVDHLPSDYLQGILQLLEFWYPIRNVIDCPFAFPNDAIEVPDYFSEKNYNDLVAKTKNWIKMMCANLAKEEKAESL